jgi:hypothetical protein
MPYENRDRIISSFLEEYDIMILWRILGIEGGVYEYL